MWAVARAEMVVAARNGEQLLLLVGLPLMLLVLLSTVDLVPTGPGDPVEFLAPGIVALAVVSAAFVRLAIGTGFDRAFGALRRFATTPLRRSELLAAKVLATAALLAGQLVVLGGTALALGWRPAVSLLAVAVAVAAGVAAFAGLGFLLAGVVDGLTALAAANTAYVALLVLSGLVFELDRLPGWLVAIAQLLPSTALGELLRHGFAGGWGSPGQWAVLAGWAVLAPAVAVARFRWE